jgi:hypothetical protein
MGSQYGNVRFSRTGLLFFSSLFCMLFAMSDGALILRGTCGARNGLSLLNSLDFAPLVGRWLRAAVTAVRESKVEFVRRSVLAISTASTGENAKEAERLPSRSAGATDARSMP